MPTLAFFIIVFGVVMFALGATLIGFVFAVAGLFLLILPSVTR